MWPIHTIGLLSRIGSIRLLFVFLLLFITHQFLPTAFATDFSSSSFTVKDSVIEQGGGISNSSSYTIISNLPYISTGKSNSASYGVQPGFLGYSGDSETTTVPTLTGTQTSISSTVEFSWTASGATSGTYELGYSRTSGSGYNYYASQTSLSQIVSGIQEGSTYFVVRARTSDGSLIGLSNEVSVTVLGGGGGIPGGGGTTTVPPGSPPFTTTPPPLSGELPTPTPETIKEEAGIRDDDTIAIILQKLSRFTNSLIADLGELLFGFEDRSIVAGPKLPFTITRGTPLAFQGQWFLLPRPPIRDLALAPLPREVAVLVEKFPDLEKTLKEVGIKKFSDLQQVRSISLLLPGLSRSSGEKKPLELNLSFNKLPKDIATRVPSEIIFARAAGGKLDFDINLSVTSKGKPAQRIRTIAGKQLNLVVKPEHSVTSVRGYLVFRSKKPTSRTSESIPTHFLSSAFFALPVFASQAEEPITTEERFVLASFDYEDPDGDGIYTADIFAPVVDGEYEVITVMDYEDIKLGSKEIRLITVVDPEGYVYQSVRGQELRIAGAVATLYQLNQETKKYELWPARDYDQENPQVTDARGTYSFLVPEGIYYLKIEAPGYLSYEGAPFVVDADSGGVHTNIELKTRYWLLDFLDAKTILLLIIIILLFYNFHRDKLREENVFHGNITPSA